MNPALLPSLAIIGTDTGVGKTVVTALLASAYKRAGLSTLPFKPVVAGLTELDGDNIYADNEFLARAAGADIDQVGLYAFPEPLSPHLAAERAGVSIDISRILARFQELSRSWPAILLEGVGGALVPLTAELSIIDLIAQINIPALIVTHAGLGTINHTLMTVEACQRRGVPVAGLVINRYPGTPGVAAATNPSQLEALSGLPIIGLVPELDLSVEKLQGFEALAGNHFDLDRLQSPAKSQEKMEATATASEALAADAAYLWHPFSAMDEYLQEKPHPLMITSAAGCWLKDSEGRRYLDGISSLWVNVHGHRHPALDHALQQQLAKVAHSTLLGLGNEPAALLAADLVSISPAGLEKVFYSDSGSTAVEIALKVAFQYFRQTGRPEKTEFISFTNAYHGDTLGAVSVGGHEIFHSTFKPLLFPTRLTPAAYCYRCPVGQEPNQCDLECLDNLAALLAERAGQTAAVIFEPKVQGAAGILVQPPGYMRRVAALCREYGVLLIADEVATGFGRTGPLFACELEEIEPDIMTVAKGLTAGYLPLSATLFTTEIYEAFRGPYEELRTFFHGHTYTGNPLAAAVARASIQLFRDTEVLSAAQERAKELASLLTAFKGREQIGNVRQQGLMVGIELVADSRTKEHFPLADRVGRAVALKARDYGVIIRPLGDTLVLMPPLSISAAELRTLVNGTTRAIDHVLGNK